MDLTKFPRRKYTPHETPIEYMPRLSKAVSNDNDRVNLWIKRDDMLGLTGGGNKTRKLEFVMADALAQGADTIVTCGAVQSNHCRLTLSACVKEGLKCCLVIEERVPDSYKEDASGNNYLFHLLGVERIIQVGLGEAPAKMEEWAKELREQEGRNVYVCPGGASNEIGATGYCACAQEIQYQLFKEQLPRFDAIVTASGSGGTHSGLVAGMTALRCDIPIIGISTRHPKDKQTDHIHKLAVKTYQHVLGDTAAELPVDAVTVYDDYVGPGYSLPTPEMAEAVTLFARTEGILLDPVYSGKAAAGFLDLVRQGTFPAGSNILFIHTGGAPTLYHYQPLAPEVSVPQNEGKPMTRKNSDATDVVTDEDDSTDDDN
ncbi:D-cysteine desulfhydrase [Seminavis robusta]|uniref:D-cysteine desulfhydrase n=1 Tax=Seminavis robusta TaxID=568900 RepID=A0A9N8EQN6_9STRA|nr:D-cysteine desulfhydrase [Seminavis robusta]|eukprot:Sro1688_g291220.1 D-cysteine desulfhydrase (373) ;mRNA; r:6102-7321